MCANIMLQTSLNLGQPEKEVRTLEWEMNIQILETILRLLHYKDMERPKIITLE